MADEPNAGSGKRYASLDQFDREFFPQSSGRLSKPAADVPRIGARVTRAESTDPARRLSNRPKDV